MDINPSQTLQHGDRGQAVAHLQKQLNKHGAALVADGIYGTATEKAVKHYQASVGLVADGIAGLKTLSTIAGEGNEKYLRESDLAKAAKVLDVELAAIKAVNQVESLGHGFLPNGKPVILFERHVMYRQLKALDPDQVEAFAGNFPNLVNGQPGGYAGGIQEHTRLIRASMIDAECAAASCSWGLFQIMGHHAQNLGYESAQAFSAAMAKSEAEQLNAFVLFIQSDERLHSALQQKKWARFARYYNGPNYKRNCYDARLAQAYQQHSTED